MDTSPQEPPAPGRDEDQKEGTDQSGLFFLLGAVILVIILLFYPIIRALVGQEYLDDHGYDGLATAFSGLAFAALWYAIHLQRKELRLQRKELALTRKELARGASAQEASSELSLKQLEVQTELLKISQRDLDERSMPNFYVSPKSTAKQCIITIKNNGAIIYDVTAYCHCNNEWVELNVGTWDNDQNRIAVVDTEDADIRLEVSIKYRIATGKYFADRMTYIQSGDPKFMKIDRRELTPEGFVLL